MENNLTKKRIIDLETIIALSFVFLLLSLVFKRNIFMFVSLGLLLIGIVSKSATEFIADYWLQFSKLLGGFNSKLILFIVFYLFLVPTSMLYRLFVKNPLLLKKDASKDTYYHERKYLFNKELFRKIW